MITALNISVCPFSVARVTKQSPDKLIYSLPIIDKMYYLSKTIGVNDLTQIDGNPALDRILFDELTKVFAEIEFDCRKRTELNIINKEISKILGRTRKSGLQKYFNYINEDNAI